MVPKHPKQRHANIDPLLPGQYTLSAKLLRVQELLGQWERWERAQAQPAGGRARVARPAITRDALRDLEASLRAQLRPRGAHRGTP
jgi:hypothetical protein